MTLSKNAKSLCDLAATSIQPGEVVTEARLLELVENLILAVAAINGSPVTDEDKSSALKELQTRQRVNMDVGTGIKEDDIKPWLDRRRAGIDPYYWTRYSTYLQKEWSATVLRSFDKTTDEILDLFGDPSVEGSWKRRGLVIGDVQSGKTATYTALCCKAADAGYQVIVLLAGSLESLRRQTQKRLDEGFAGLDSSEFLPTKSKDVPRSRAVGAGLGNQSRFATVFTSRTKDFNRDVLNSRQLTLRAQKEPVLFVIKKHKSIIENLTAWLKAYNADNTGSIGESLLLIDDEADNASVNTNKDETDPTAVNKSIRELLSVFRRRTYVGFTATPFANVFIDPDTSDEDFFKEELFPRDFIYALEAPSNYIGATRIFGDDGVPGFLEEIDDAEACFPLKHKSSYRVDTLPDTLLQALYAFISANAIRDLRGQTSSHRSMLVNVSRFTAVQDQVRDLLDAELDAIKQHVRSFSKLPFAQAMESPVLARLKETFDKQFANTGHAWKDVQKQLLDATAPISLRSVNQKAGAASLDYSKYEESGLRVIAVGGNSLSRGLTLEGLTVSYFYRNAQAYDTLLQMGRWFGYRKGYEDVCRLWITADAQQWYAHVTMAADELRDEVKRMQREDLTPRDFGLKVRAHPDSLILTVRKLLVTARNKMRTANTVTRQISWSKEGAETTKLRTASNKVNCLAVERLIRSMQKEGYGRGLSEWGNPLFRDVPKTLVAQFLDEFAIHPRNFQLYTAEEDRQSYGLSKFIRETSEASLQAWDVVIPQGAELDEIDLFHTGITIKPARRGITTDSGDKTIMVSGTKARVGSRGVEREGIDKEIVDSVAPLPGKKNVSDAQYRAIRARPLLILYVIRPYNEDKLIEGLVDGNLLVAFGLSFPDFDDQSLKKTVTYKVNLIEWRKTFEDEEDEESEDDLDD
ncbi:MAG: endonuclease [Aquabacterium sp.]|uniref:Z1 domain-containing protein n=1 Tax=Aquabacterium sp. TaxID=1872578 RepID=UPI001209BF20|nr:Z1 domain-containing protein [Aquabacterium sp.]TAK91935.1 MAG: endonuclease [Aquabacterium sp.]